MERDFETWAEQTAAAYDRGFHDGVRAARDALLDAARDAREAGDIKRCVGFTLAESEITQRIVRVERSHGTGAFLAVAFAHQQAE